MLLQILVGGLVVFVIFFLVFRAIRTGNLPRHDDSQPEDGENRDQHDWLGWPPHTKRMGPCPSFCLSFNRLRVSSRDSAVPVP
ncbi:hypothetical protein BVL54_00115 [Bacillus paralicheniformis]|nr:hypothetical protein BVL54_00115 [Bacillus paralicheniformis]